MTISNPSRKPAQFIGTLWGVIRTFSIAAIVFSGDRLIISPTALRVLMVLMERVKTSNRYRREPEGLAKVRVGHALLMKRTGLSTNTVTRALKELEAVGFVEADKGHEERGRYRRRGRFTIKNYYLIIPKWDASTGRMVVEPLIYRKGQSLFYKTGVGYLSLPSSIVKETDARWSLANMSNSEVALYCSLLDEARRQRTPQFSFDKVVLRERSALSRPSFKKALHSLQSTGLIRLICAVEDTGTEVEEVVLCNPMDGESLTQRATDPESNPANYFVNVGKRERRVDLNSGTPEQIEALIRSLLPPGSVVYKQPNNGNLKICCPFHREVINQTDNEPSCSVYLNGGFHCFGCNKNGSLRELVKQLSGKGDREAILYIAQAMGQDATFREPDTNFEAIYDYRDANGVLLYQKLRRPGKKFSYRTHASRGWIYKLLVKPILYNLPKLKDARIVYICEGEKDCDRLNALGLVDTDGRKIVATTSGGAKSWEDQFADAFLGKRIIVLPDADSAGIAYANEIGHSLYSRRIEYREVSFEGSGCKDVSEFLDKHSVEELIELIGTDWVRLPTPEPKTREEVLEPALPQIIVQEQTGGQMQAVFDH